MVIVASTLHGQQPIGKVKGGPKNDSNHVQITVPHAIQVHNSNMGAQREWMKTSMLIVLVFGARTGDGISLHGWWMLPCKMLDK